MSDKSPGWYHRPSKIQVQLVVGIYLVTVILLIAAITDFFQESIFQSKYIVVLLLIGGATGLPKQVYNNYRKQQE